MLNDIKAETNIKTNYIYTNSNEVKAELLKEALLDSRQKAIDIAEALNQKVVGLISANKKNIYGAYDDDESNDICEADCAVPQMCKTVPDFLRRSNALSSPEITESEEIFAVWEIE